MKLNAYLSQITRANFRKNHRQLRLLSVGTGAILLAGVGCLERPIGISKPVTTNVVVQKENNTAITAIDLLIMIDNSSSMADKQQTLADAVPQLLQQLVQPQCVDADGKPFDPPVYAQLGIAQPCSTGTAEFNPVNDIHIGIVTSSLGDHGYGAACQPGAASGYSDSAGPIPLPLDVNDMSHLVGTLARGTAAFLSDTTLQPADRANLNSQGFLAWGNDQQSTPGVNDLAVAETIFGDMVTAAAEKGCGYEAQLESWFRFLIDPVPPKLPIAPADERLRTSRQGVDDELLAQRAKFLRPDSLVAIVMLTDENDCSLRDTDYGWIAVRSDAISTGSAACATNPNDPCCYQCGMAPPAGCAPSCPNPTGAEQPTALNDFPRQAGIRCWQQKRRFGMEFTYPTSRYSVALTKKELCPDQSFGDMDCDCTYAKSIGVSCYPGDRRFANPLYSTVVGQKSDGTKAIGYPGAIARSDNSAVFLAGIVGVPWQDISEPDSQAVGKALAYIPVTDSRWSSDGGIWNQIYADFNDHEKLPLDPRMVESIRPRTGLPAPTAGVGADPVIGHEWNTALADLEYACIYRLPQPKECKCTSSTDSACRYNFPNDCCILSYEADTEGHANSGDSNNKPLCQNPTTGTYNDTQYFAKGYPGLRELAVLHDYAMSSESDMVRGNSIVASICPKDVDPNTAKTSPGYGYNPAVAALVNRLKDVLKGSCLPRPLSPDADGKVSCNVVEALSNDKLGGKGCFSYCTDNGRNREVSSENPSGGPSAKMRAAVVELMQQSDICDNGPDSPACSDMCLCLLSQESKTENTLGIPGESDLGVCQNVNDGTETRLPPGYCYVDPELKDSSGGPIAGSNPGLVAKCPATQRRILRYVGNNPGGGVPVPLPNSFVFTACQGSAISGE